MPSTPETAHANRRSSPRRRPRSAVRAECRKGSTGLGANIVVAVLDVSECGARLIVSQALDPKSEVEVVLAGYGVKDPVRRVANVRWQLALENGQFCIGVEFQKRLVYRDWQNFASPN